MSDTIHLVLFPSKSHAILRAECTRAPCGPSTPARPSTSLFVVPGPPNAAHMGGPPALRAALTLLDQASLRQWGGKGGQAAQQPKRTPGHAASTGTSASAGVRQQASAARIPRTTQAPRSLRTIRGRFGGSHAGGRSSSVRSDSIPFDHHGTAQGRAGDSVGRRMSDDDWDTGKRALVHRTVFDHASLHVHVHVTSAGGTQTPTS